jgi:hypothetical protein
MALGWKILLPLSLVIVFITAAGVLLAEDNPIWIWSIPIASLFVGFLTVLVIYRDLRRKAYEYA